MAQTTKVPAAPKNAIERRLDYLAETWNAFALDPKARILRWLVDNDGERLLEVFFETQNEESSELPDLFVRISVPHGEGSYARLIVEDFLNQYSSDREALESEGVDASWRPPQMPADWTDVEKCAACLISFQQHYAESVALLALVLTPSAIADSTQWANDLFLLSAYLPETIRVTVIDRIESPLLQELARASGDRIVTVTPELDMARAILQLANEEGRTGPGIEFRRRFMELANLAPSGNIAAMETKASAAIAIAEEQKWPALQTAVCMLLAAGYASAGDNVQSAATYRHAAQSAIRAKEAGDPSGSKLALQSQLGEAAVLLQNGSLLEAAHVYQSAAPLAVETDQPLLHLECWRMAGYCQQQAGQPQAAWESLWRGLQVTEAMDPAARKQSTLPYLGESLIELTGRPEYQAHRPLVQDKLNRLMESA